MDDMDATARQKLATARLRLDGETTVACLALGAERSLLLGGAGEPAAAVALDLGTAKTARQQLRGDPPTPYQLERAIEVIEDEVLRARPLLPAASALIVFSPGTDTLTPLARAGTGAEPLVLAEVETLYRALARTSERGAYTSDTPFQGRESWAAAVILRELMHHTGYRAVWIDAS